MNKRRFHVAVFLMLFLLLWPVRNLASSVLSIPSGGVQKAEDAPNVSENYRFLPGDYVYCDFQVGGYSIKGGPDEPGRTISLKYSVAMEDKNGVLLANADEQEIQAELAAEDKNWTPKRRASFLLPSFLAAGDYRIRVSVEDLIAKQRATREFSFRVGGVAIVPADAVAVQDFRFFRREDDREALETPAFTPGDVVFARFNMTNFKTTKENGYRLAYGVSVLRPDGKSYYQEPNAANLESSSFYPAQFVPGAINLTTSKDARKGEYVIVLSVKDLVGRGSREFKTSFTIE